MIRSIEFTSVTGRFAMDVAELLLLVQRGDNDLLWPMYAAE
jgi:hypothetical protein